MDPVVVGWQLLQARRRAGLTQAEVADRMGTTQSSISRTEAGRTLPSLDFIDRYARACGVSIRMTFGSAGGAPRRRPGSRARQVLAGYRFNPWERDPSEAEAKTLVADGLTRERFEGP